MRPEGHLATATAATVAAYETTGSVELAAGVFCGAFWIDLDHYVDYLLVERQYSLNPLKFARYYLETKAKRLVLVLHSYELMGCLSLAALLTRWPPLLGYVVGAVLHLALDLRYNTALRDPVRFYSFWHRLRRGFRSVELLEPFRVRLDAGRDIARDVGAGFLGQLDQRRPEVGDA